MPNCNPVLADFEKYQEKEEQIRKWEYWLYKRTKRSNYTNVKES